jgi:hypothetical protein
LEIDDYCFLASLPIGTAKSHHLARASLSRNWSSGALLRLIYVKIHSDWRWFQLNLSAKNGRMVLGAIVKAAGAKRPGRVGAAVNELLLRVVCRPSPRRILEAARCRPVNPYSRIATISN